MALVVVGGSTRNIGKTSVVAGLIAAMPGRNWTAVKITQYGHGICSADGKPCDCATADHSVAVTEELDRSGRSDSSRYLGAGAARSVWVRTQQGGLFEAMPRLRALLASTANVIAESNSLLQFLRPDVYVSVLDPAIEDFKGSARRFLDRADVILMPRKAGTSAGWKRELQPILRRARVMHFEAGAYVSADLVMFVEARMRETDAEDVEREVMAKASLEASKRHPI